MIDLAIDPGQAFGTGSHSTTRLCLELLLELEPRGSFADLGCGSGVLAIAAARLGFGPVTALDYDPEAVAATLANARDNGVALDRVERVNLREQAPPTADVVAANLMRPLLLRVAELMVERPPVLILSGLLDDEADEVAAAFAPLEASAAAVGQGLERGPAHPLAGTGAVAPRQCITRWESTPATSCHHATVAGSSARRMRSRQ